MTGPILSPLRIIAIAALLFFGLTTAAAADFYVSGHLGLEFDQTSAPRLTPGADLRLIGGRGAFGSLISVDYLGTNYRAYDSNSAPGSALFLVTTHALLQASIYYGDVTIYAGPGSSIGIRPGAVLPIKASFSTLAEDGLVHFLLGGAYNLYPLQFFAEAEVDIVFAAPFSGFASPRFRIGAGLVR